MSSSLYIADEDERPSDIAQKLGVDVAHLVDANRAIRGIRANSRHVYTICFVPPATCRDARARGCILLTI